MKKKLWILSILFLLTSTSLFSQNSIKLEGPWDFYWGKFLTADQAAHTQADCQIMLPETWNKNPYIPIEDQKFAKYGKGSATYHLLVQDLKPDTLYGFRTYDLASTAIVIYVNDILIYQAGIPNADWTQTHMDQRMKLASFKSDSEGKADFIIHVSNKDYRKGGIWNEPVLSEYSIASKAYTDTIHFYCILAGILIAVTLYSFFLSLLKKDPASLFMGLFTLFILVRLIASDFPILKQFFPIIPYEIMLRLEFSPLFLTSIFYIYYLRFLDENIFRGIPIKILAYFAIFFSAITFFAPIKYSNWLVPGMQAYLIVCVLLVLFGLVKYIIKYKNFIGIFCLASVAGIFIGAVDDILISNQTGIRLFGSMMLPFAFVIMCICHTVILAIIQSKSEKKVMELYDYLSTTNKAYYRFVPKQFLELFNKKDISEMEIGDKVTKDMMILSADIRNFTSISEKLTGMQVFDLLNSYFAQIAPVIKKHGGIIEKYLGDGIVVLFQKDYDQALDCAIELQEQMVKLREVFAEKELPELRIGIGVHYGNILVGTAGDSSRMSEVAISTELSVLQHVESATKRYNKSIVVTKEAMVAATKDVLAKGQRFDFYGKKITQALGHELYYIYNDNISKDL